MVARDDERARFSRDLTRAMWHRWFTMNRYLSTIEAGFPGLDQDRAWDRYATVFEEWNRDLMVNILSLEQYYQGTLKRDQFENRIQPMFRRLHACLQGLRRPETATKCCPYPEPKARECEQSSTPPTRDLDRIRIEMGRLNQDLYCFATGLPRNDVSTPCFSDSTEELDSDIPDVGVR
jgi:hypothetical protein